MSGPAQEARREELAAQLADVRHRLDAACAAAGRVPEEVALVAVTKTWPATDVALLHGLGLREFAENRDQEASGKARELQHLEGVRWHFVGQLQTNKARSVASYAHVVQSVDRLAVATALARGAEQAGRALEVLLQVSLDEPVREDGRGGVAPVAVLELAEAVAALPGLRLAGLMAVAPRVGDPAAAFARLAGVAASLRAAHTGAVTVSAGMSGDLEAAVAAGATSVRVGTALLGAREAAGR